MPDGRWLIDDENEGIIERWVITGRLTLETPAHFGNGETSVLTDMPLLRDPLQGRALLSGTSIAGALRSYLREYERGYGKSANERSRAAQLFGYNLQAAKIGFASLLTVDDALGKEPQTELRDGVSINPDTRTADEGKLFNIELLPAGTTFDLCFELLIPAGEDAGRLENKAERERLVESLAIALRGLEAGQIGLGKRKRRGLGRCRAGYWQVERYTMDSPQQLVAWLKRPLEPQPAEADNKEIWSLLQPKTLPTDRRDLLTLEASFTLDSSLMIRAYAGGANEPDAIHLHSNGAPILSGTSLAGALRARARRIVNTLKLPDADLFIAQLFGDQIEENGHKKKLYASRVLVKETKIKDALEMVQSRIKIDRFTGGVYPGALFNEQPVFGKPETEIDISLCIIQPIEKEIGLLLLLLKDLWTGDLPLGGESSIGRGRLQGQAATVSYQTKGKTETWKLEKDGKKLNISSETRQALHKYVTALTQEEA